MRLRVRAGQAREVGQRGQRDVHPERAGPAAIRGDACAEVVGQVLGRDETLAQELRVHVGDHAPAFDHLAGLELDAGGAARPHQHARNRRLRAQHDAARRALGGHRLRDRPHAADRVSPLAGLAVDLAEHVVQQHVGRARRVGAREVADDGVEAERRLDRRAVEPAVEHVARALGEEVEEVAPLGQRQPAQAPAGAREVDERRRVAHDAGADVGRRDAEHAAQDGGDAVEHRVVARQRVGVAAGEPGDLRLRGGETAAHLQEAALRQRQEVREWALAHDEPVRGEVQVARDLRVEQADRVARRRVAEARVELLGDRGAAHDGPALDDAHRKPGGGQVRGADEPVVAAAEDDRVEPRRVTPRRQARPRRSRSRNRRT